MRTRLIVLAALTATLLAFSYAPPVQAKPASAAPMAKKRAELAHDVFTTLISRYQAGMATVDDVGTWGRRWYLAERDAGITGAALVAAAKTWVASMHQLEVTVAKRVRAGVSATIDLDKAHYYRLDAEMELARVSPTTQTQKK